MTKLRFTDADKWRDPWFQELPLVLKALWQYLTDNCDNAGVWVVNRREAEFHLGQAIDWDLAAKALSGRVEALSPAKWHLTKFVSFQHPGGLSRKSAPHRQVMRLLDHHGLPYEIKDGGVDGSLPCRLQPSTKDTAQPRQGLVRGSAEGGRVSVEDLLAKHGLPCGSKEVKEWAGGLNRTVRCRSQEEAEAFLEWAKDMAMERAQIVVRYWRHVIDLGAEWDSTARPKCFRQAEAS